MSDDLGDRGAAGRPAVEPRRSGRLVDWGLALGVLAATAAFTLWAPGAARTVGAWLGFAP